MDAATLDRKPYISLATYKRNGDEVRTPVWFAERAGRLYVFTEAKALPGAAEEPAAATLNALPAGESSRIAEEITTYLHETDAPACHVCGYIMVRNGACHKCENCGSTSGCS